MPEIKLPVEVGSPVMPEIKLPVEVGILRTTFYNSEGQRAKHHDATEVVMGVNYSVSLTFKWPEQAEEAFILSKMIRDAYDAGQSAKASEIRACLEIPEME